MQWTGFLRKGRLLESPPALDEIVALLASFLMPPTQALAANEPWNRTWVPAEWR
ncbi:MAG: hypothetical protein NT069_07900 [Planctomycetota bacterium]|nr:hypothetical protein [Planctomycetota bacterium]